MNKRQTTDCTLYCIPNIHSNFIFTICKQNIKTYINFISCSSLVKKEKRQFQKCLQIIENDCWKSWSHELKWLGFWKFKVCFRFSIHLNSQMAMHLHYFTKMLHMFMLLQKKQFYYWHKKGHIIFYKAGAVEHQNNYWNMLYRFKLYVD